MHDGENNTGVDFLASEMLSELKLQNKRKDRLILSLLAALVLVVVAFLLYLNQYDFSSSTTQEATGVYALIDSQGNMITADKVTDEQLNAFIEEVANGHGAGNDGETSD